MFRGRKTRFRGKKKLHGCVFRVPADRIAAGTWLLAGAAERGTVELDGVSADEMEAVLKVYRKMGGQYRVCGDKLFTDSSQCSGIDENGSPGTDQRSCD